MASKENNVISYLLSIQRVPQNGGVVLPRGWGKRAEVEGGVSPDAHCFIGIENLAVKEFRLIVPLRLSFS